MSRHLSIERLGLLLRADLMLRLRTILITSGTIAGLILVHGGFTAASGNPRTDIFPIWFYGSLFVWGALAASYSFPELHDKLRNQGYLLLPASALEKTLSRLLIVTVLFIPFVIALLMVVSWLNAAVCLLLFGERVPMFRPVDLVSAQILGHAVVVQSVYFLGAAWFRRAHFVKTAFAITLIVNAFGVVVAVIFWALYRDMLGPGQLGGAQIYNANRPLFALLNTVGPLLYFFVLPPFCWWVAWLRVGETQVSHGV